MPELRQVCLGIDFGTSNSAMAWASGAQAAQLIPLEGAATSMPTALFFNSDDRSTHFGRDAVAQYLSGADGRLMRSLKSLLGSALLLETTPINQQLVSYQDIIAAFLGELRQRAEHHLKFEITSVVLGRPVHFVDDDPQRDHLAQTMLEQAARHAGFANIRFQFEPIAAALDYERRVMADTLVLVADIGGGTSDFSVVRLGPKRMHKADRADDVLATAGIHIGGTDFDQKLSLENVMPLFGFRHLGPRHREVPSRTFFDLSTWHLIHWLSAPKAVREARELRNFYTDTVLHDRLMTVLDQRFGHRLVNLVELAKIESSFSGAAVPLDLSFVEPGLQASLNAQEMARHLNELLARTVACAQDCVQGAGLKANQLDAIYVTGGSSLLRPFQTVLQAGFAGVPLVEGDRFGGVASGLAYFNREG